MQQQQAELRTQPRGGGIKRSLEGREKENYFGNFYKEGILFHLWLSPEQIHVTLFSFKSPLYSYVFTHIYKGVEHLVKKAIQKY